MAYPTGSVQVTGPIGTTNTSDTYNTHFDNLGQGGLMTVDTISTRNAISTTRRKFGMIVSVYADPTPANNKMYILANSALGGTNNTITDNSNWIALSSIIGGGHVIQSNGTSLTQRLILNVLNGLTALDDSGSNKTTIAAGGILIADLNWDGNGTYDVSFTQVETFTITADTTINLTGSGIVTISGDDVNINNGIDPAATFRDTEVEFFRPIQLKTVASNPAAVSAQLLYNSATLDIYGGVNGQWVAMTRPEIIDTSASFITLNESHRNKIIRCTSATLQTVTLGTLSNGFQCVLVKTNDGDVQLQTSGTLDAVDTLISTLDGAATVVSRGSNNWMAFGALGAGGGVILTDGNGTTANGSSIDLGGTITNNTYLQGFYIISLTSDELGVGQSQIVAGPTAAYLGYQLNDNSITNLLSVDVAGINALGNVILNAGTTSWYPIRFQPGTHVTTPVDGALEYDGTHLYFTIGSTRFQLDQQGGGGGIADGDYGNITVSGTGSIWTIDNDVVTFAKMQNSAAAGLSVIGRNTNSAGDFAEINAANDFEVLRRSGNTIGFGTVSTNGIANSAVTRAKISNGLELSVIGRSANSIGVTADIQATAASNAVFRESGSTIGWGSINLASSGAVGTSILGVPNGGTGLATLAAGRIPYGNGTAAFNSDGNFTFASGILSIPLSLQSLGTQLSLIPGTSGILSVYHSSWSSAFKVTENGAGELITEMGDVSSSGATGWTIRALNGIAASINGKSMTIKAGDGYATTGNGNGGNLFLQAGDKRTAGAGSEGFAQFRADAVGFASTVYGGSRIALQPRTGGYVNAGTASGIWTKTLAAGTNSFGLYTERAVITDASASSTHSLRVTINSTEYDILLKVV